MTYKRFIDIAPSTYGNDTISWHNTFTVWGNQPVDTNRPLLTLAEVNYLMRCAKKDVRLGKILQKLTEDDDAFEIEVAFYTEDVVKEEKD